MTALENVAEKLGRRERLTPAPAYQGVCGIPVEGLFAHLTYQCQCGAYRLEVTPVLVGLKVGHHPVICLLCGSDRTTFQTMEFAST